MNMATGKKVYDLDDHQLSCLKRAAENLMNAVDFLITANLSEIAVQLNPVADSLIGLLSKNPDPVWEPIEVPAGKPRHGMKLNPFPVGPYLITDQADPVDYTGMSIHKVLKEYRHKMKNEVPGTLGSVAYYLGNDHKLSKCFYFFDTSD